MARARSSTHYARPPGFVRQRLTEALGVLLAVIACFYLLALTTYTPTDPSFNAASSGIVINGGGLIGAYIADLSLQLNGVASGLILLVCQALTWRLMSKSYLRGWWIRISSLFCGLIALSVLLAIFTPPASWSLQTGLGGAIGDVVHYTALSIMSEWVLMLMAAVIFIAALPMTMGLRWGEWVALSIVLHRLLAQCGKVFSLVNAILRGSGSGFVSPALSERKKAGWGKRVFFWRMGTKPAKVKKTTKSKRKTRSIVEQKQTKKQVQEKAQSSLELRPKNINYGLPSVQLLDKVPVKRKSQKLSESALQQNAQMLESVLNDFGVNGDITRVRPGPVVTLYELEPAAGTKSSRVIGLADDIARSMSAISARISVIPGRNALGIELPNLMRETVYLRESIEEKKFQETECRLPLILGKDIGGDPVIADLARMPHLLVAGTTGSGKSVAINTMIMSLVYHLPPEQCKFIMIDPKMLELSVYDDIPHLLSPVVTEPGKAVVALKWTVREMENRYRLMSNLGVRNVDNYNKRIKEAVKRGEELTRTVQTGFDPETGKPIMENVSLEMNPLPYIVVVVDEMADLMLVAGKDIEGSIQRLAQMARAAGIHIIMATQRPSVDVITGVIKANFPTRISFQVTSKIDSRTILGEQGAEQLLGQGDMLYMAGGGRITRVHGPFISDKEVERVVDYLKTQGEPEYDEGVTEEVDDAMESGFGGDEDPETDLYRRAVQIVLTDRKASTSYIQRKLKIGYNRAARLIDRMEEDGIVGQANHVGKREVIGRAG